VTRQHLLDAVWDGPVGENALTVCVNELRSLLSGHSCAGSSQDTFIATVHRSGYRFLPAVHLDLPPPTTPASVAPPPDDRLAVLDAWWAAASSGTPTSGVVVGPRRAGKSTLVRAFHHRLARAGVAAALARCIPPAPGTHPHGDLEVFVDLFGALCRGPAATSARAALARYAPSWLARMPSLMRQEVYEQLAARTRAATTERMFREAADVFDAMSAHVPVALLIDDVETADEASTALLSLLADRPSSARLLLVATSSCPIPSTWEHLDLSPADGLAVLDDSVARARWLLAERAPDVALRTWLRQVARRIRARPDALAMLIAAAPRRPAAARAHRRVVAAVTTLLDDGARSGSLRSDVDPEVVTALFYGVLRTDPGAATGTVAHLLDLVVDGLRLNSPDTGRGPGRALNVRLRTSRGRG
jgi:hypothetical protein